MLTLRASGALAAVVLGTLLIGNYLHPYWIRAFMDGRAFEPVWEWWSPGWLTLTWGYDVLLTLVGALVLALILPRGFGIWWYVALGIVIAIVRLLSSHNFVSRSSDSEMTAAAAVWIYGSYFMSAIGGTIGGAIAIVLKRFASLPNNRWSGP
jgi:hypothetical protein